MIKGLTISVIQKIVQDFHQNRFRKMHMSLHAKRWSSNDFFFKFLGDAIFSKALYLTVQSCRKIRMINFIEQTLVASEKRLFFLESIFIYLSIC